MCRTGLNNAESLLNEKEKKLIECQVALNQENMLNTNLTNKYDELQTLYATEKENYQLQHSQLSEKVKIILAPINYYYDHILIFIIDIRFGKCKWK